MDATTEGDLLLQLYEAASGDRSWTSALGAIGDVVRAPLVALCRRTLDTRQTSVVSTYAADALSATDIRHSIEVVAPIDHRHSIHLVACRPGAREPFDADDRLRLATLLPHVRQALRLAERLADHERLRGLVEEVGDRLGKGLALLDASGRVVLSNAWFDRLCDTHDGLAVNRGVLTTARPGLAALSQLVEATARGGPGGALDIPRPSGLPPYTLVVTPVSRPAGPAGADEARVSVIVTDPALAHGPSEAVLQHRFGLTRAESRMVARLVDGATVVDTACELGISLNTARTHLKRAMAKAGVSRQAELVRVLLATQ